MSVVPSGDLDELRSTRTFRDIDAGALRGLLGRGARRECRRAQTVREAGDAEGDALLVVRGMVRLDRVSPEGEPAAVDVLSPGGIHGTVPGSPDPGLKCRVVAIIEGTVIYRLRATELASFIRARPELLERAAAATAYAAARAHDRIDAVVSRPVLIRLAHLLCELAKRHSLGWISETQEELAALIDSSPRQVRRAIAKLAERGLVVTVQHRPGLWVPQADRLVHDVDPDAE